MLAVALLVLATMAVKDNLGACYTAFVARGRAGLAASFDAAGDIAGTLTYGIGGVEAIRHGLSAYTLVIFTAMIAGSYAGTYTGVWLSHWIDHHAQTTR